MKLESSSYSLSAKQTGNISDKFNIPHINKTREAVMYFMAQSCLHVVINFTRPPKPDQNAAFYPFYRAMH